MAVNLTKQLQAARAEQGETPPAPGFRVKRELQPAQHHLQIAQTIGWRGNPLTASLVPKGLG